jgi:Na+/glutamate symporter
VGVGEAFGAEVIKTKGSCGTGVGAVPQAASKIVSRKISLRMDDFIGFVIALKFKQTSYCFIYPIYGDVVVRLGTIVDVGRGDAVKGNGVNVSGSVGNSVGVSKMGM